MDITTNREIIWERIKSGGPTSVIVSNKEEKVKFVPNFLKVFKKELSVNKIIPICIDCEQISSSFMFFKEIFFSIWNLITPENKERFELFKDAIETANETSTLDAIMENFMSMVKKDMNINLLLILDNFDTSVADFEEPDLMKIRGMSCHVNMLTVTTSSLEMLAIENQKEDYYCNQFKAFIV